MKTPNNKSWEEKMTQEIMKFSVQYFALNSHNPLQIPSQLQRALIKFCSIVLPSLLQQERKAERERVVDEIFEVILNDAKSEDSTLTLNKLCLAIITKLNQLKEE